MGIQKQKQHFDLLQKASSGLSAHAFAFSAFAVKGVNTHASSCGAKFSHFSSYPAALFTQEPRFYRRWR